MLGMNITGFDLFNRVFFINGGVRVKIRAVSQTFLLEDNHIGRQPQWKMTSMEVNSMKDDLNGRQPQWKTTSIEDDLI